MSSTFLMRLIWHLISQRTMRLVCMQTFSSLESAYGYRRFTVNLI